MDQPKISCSRDMVLLLGHTKKQNHISRNSFHPTNTNAVNCQCGRRINQCQQSRKNVHHFTKHPRPKRQNHMKGVEQHPLDYSVKQHWKITEGPRQARKPKETCRSCPLKQSFWTTHKNSFARWKSSKRYDKLLKTSFGQPQVFW